MSIRMHEATKLRTDQRRSSGLGSQDQCLIHIEATYLKSPDTSPTELVNASYCFVQRLNVIGHGAKLALQTGPFTVVDCVS